MFGYRIIHQDQVDALVRAVSDDTVRECARVALMGCQNAENEYARGRIEAANDVLELLTNPKG